MGQEEKEALKEKKMRILIVDDEPTLLESISRGLFLYGFDSIKATHAGMAMELLNSEIGPNIDVLITDLTMPGKSGAELIELAHCVRPNLPVIVISGLTLNPELEKLRKKGIPILQKPFDPETLNTMIRQLLNHRQAI